MHIKKIRVENARAFGEGDHALDLDFSTTGENLAGWYVFAGPNGSGKSSILQAIALCLNNAFRRINWNESVAQGFIHKKRKFVKGTCSHSLGEISFKVYQDMSRVVNRKGGKQVSPSRFNRRAGWFIASYGAHRMPYFRELQLRENEIKTKFDSIGNFFSGNHLLSEGLNWLKQLHFMALEGKPGAKETEEATLAIITDGLLPGKFDSFSITSEGLWAHQGNEKFLLTQLGDGPQSLLSMVIDMIMRLYLAFGDKLKVEYEPTPRVLNSGIVLIDEAENHLHPEWQQKLGFWFKEHFPNLQFLVTTHSPFICQAADPGRLYRVQAPEHLRRPGEGAVKQVSDDTYKRIVNGGADAAAISELFGLEHAHSPAAEKLRDDIASLEAKEAFGTLTKKEKETLQTLLDKLPSSMSVEVERALRSLNKANAETQAPSSPAKNGSVPKKATSKSTEGKRSQSRSQPVVGQPKRRSQKEGKTNAR